MPGLSGTVVIHSLKMLRRARMAATRKLQHGVRSIGEWQVWAVRNWHGYFQRRSAI